MNRRRLFALFAGAAAAPLSVVHALRSKAAPGTFDIGQLHPTMHGPSLEVLTAAGWSAAPSSINLRTGVYTMHHSMADKPVRITYTWPPDAH